MEGREGERGRREMQGRAAARAKVGGKRRFFGASASASYIHSLIHTSYLENGKQAHGC